MSERKTKYQRVTYAVKIYETKAVAEEKPMISPESDKKIDRLGKAGAMLMNVLLIALLFLLYKLLSFLVYLLMVILLFQVIYLFFS